MTDTRTASARRPADPAGERPDRAAAGSWPVRERSMLRPVLGIPPLAAVALALGLTVVGVFADLLRLGTVGTVFQLGYGAGCVLAVAWVRRRSLFLPAIQPPLLLAVVVPVLAVLVGAPAPTAGAAEHLLMAGAPLINAFPAMAVTTGLVLLVAGYRLLRQRTGPDDAAGRLRSRLSGDRGPAPAKDAVPPARRATSGRGSSRGGRGSGRDGARPDTGRDRGRSADAGATPGRTGTGRGTGSGSSARRSGRTGATATGWESAGRGSASRTRADGAGDTRDPGRSDAGRRTGGRPSGRTGASGRDRGTRTGRDGDTASGRTGGTGSGRPDRRPRPSGGGTTGDAERPRRPRQG